MGNVSCYSCSPCQEQNEISPDVIRALEGMHSMEKIEELIAYIDTLLSNKGKGRQEPISRPTSVDSGGHLMEKLSNRLNRHVCKKCFLSALDRQTRNMVIEVINQAQPIPCVGMALSIIAYLVERAEQVSSNKEQCLQLLGYMSVLAKHMKNLDPHLSRAKLDAILCFIVKGTLMCALLMQPNRSCRFIFAPIEAADLENLKSQLLFSYPDLALEAVTEAFNRLPIYPGPSQGEYQDAVGIEEAEKEVTKLLDLAESSPRVVVIYGVGGIGKTTLASAVFRSLDLTEYHYCRVDMDQDCKLTDLQAMQEQILSNLFKENLKLNNYTHGREKLRQAFEKASKPVFLFIDNALRQTDLEKLLPIKHISDLPMRSRILITTRNLKETNIFSLHDGIEIYSHRVDSFSKPEAKRLLCYYAVGDRNGNFDRGVNIDGLMQICGGIPLVLRIVGSHLRAEKLRRDGNAVLDTLQYFKEWLHEGFEGGEEDVSESIVGFVYGRLKEPCKQAFLDIAFFFHGWERSKIADIFGEVQLQDLELAALVTTTEEDRWENTKRARKTVVKMHDIVRARGKKLSEGTRITDIESLSILLSDAQKLQQTKGIWLRNANEELSLEAKHMDLMSTSLRVLRLGWRMRLNERCHKAFGELRFLDISYEDKLPVDLFKASRLVFFQGHLIKGHTMSEPKFTLNLPESLRIIYLDAPENFSVSLDINGHLTSVRELRLSHITFENFETNIRIGNFPCLKILNVNYCSNLERLPDSFGTLSSLEVLYMRNCSKLQRLPESFGTLFSLRDLDMSNCSKLQRLPDSFGTLSSLGDLDMSNCSKLQGLPDSFGNLCCLQTLDMSDCSMVERLPESFGTLSSLQDLYMTDCSKLQELPESFGNLSCLQTLIMRRCSMLERLSDSFGNLCSLRALDMSRCSMLERLPKSFENLSSLQILHMFYCSELERFPQTFDQLSCLQTLEIRGCQRICSLSDNIGQLKCLKFLNISNCKDLKKLPDDIVCLTSLVAIKAYGCAKLEAKAMEMLVEIRSLMFLDIDESPLLIKRWEEIQQHPSLTGLPLRLTHHKCLLEYEPDEGTVSTMFFSGGTTFLHVDGDGHLAQMVPSSLFTDVAVKVYLLFTACPLSKELKKKLLEVASQEFQIIYVDGDMEGEAEGSTSSWMEEREKRIRERLLQLPEGSRAWTCSFYKTRLLFAYSLWGFFTGPGNTSIVGTRVLVDGEGRRKLSQPFEKMLGRDSCETARVELRTVFNFLSEVHNWMESFTEWKATYRRKIGY